MYKNGLMSKEFTQLEQLAIHNHEAWSLLQAQLVDIRLEKGTSQAQMAVRLGISQSAVSQFESVTTMPRLGSVLAYALAVGAELDLRATAVQSGHELDHDLI
jgi:transcriptional regulator with XRE-family HTH domain